jgi:hypothetical protein
MLPAPDAQIVMVSAVLDRLVPRYVAHDYRRAMRAKGRPSIELINVADAGHFDLVTPGTKDWEKVSRRIVAALGLSG